MSTTCPVYGNSAAEHQAFDDSSASPSVNATFT